MSLSQQKNAAYHSVEEYYCDLTRLGKQWISHYCEKAVSVTPQGELLRIRGKLLFAEELSRLCTEPFSEAEKAEYEAETARLKQELIQIRQKSLGYIAEGEMITMEYVCRMFGFTAFEWFLFVMAFLPELDPQFERVFGLLQDDLSLKAPALDLCIRMYSLRAEERFALQRQAIERFDFLSGFFVNWEEKKPAVSGILSLPLKLDQRIVRFLYDMDSTDCLLQGAVRLYLLGEPIAPMLIRKDLTVRLDRLYEEAEKHGFVYLSGGHDSGKKFLVRHFCRDKGRPLLMVDILKLPVKEEPLERLIPRLAREAVLKGNAIVCFQGVECGADDREAAKAFERVFACLKRTRLTPIFISVNSWSHSIDTGGMRCMELKLEDTTMEEREILWRHLLLERNLTAKVSYERLADRYQLPPGAILRAMEEAMSRMLFENADVPVQKIVYAACQKQLVHQLGKDAVRINTQYTMEDLILPRLQKQMLKDACNLVEYRHQVYDKWGFREKAAYGRGVSMIFYGPPGTGKTMGAQAIAGELNLELYRVDLAGILSKYVGESEKKLGSIFEQGQKSQSILFFDEADALFGKRSEVKDSQDKYANAGTAYLLQKIEEYEGTIILATNLLQNFDAAFCRRFRFIIEFPFPDVKRREEIWKKVFPDRLPMEEEIDTRYLAEEFRFSGSQIKNIAVSAAFLAAGEKRAMNMRYLLKALKREVKKTGKNMIAGDFGKYYSLMEQEEGEG